MHTWSIVGLTVEIELESRLRRFASPKLAASTRAERESRRAALVSAIVAGKIDKTFLKIWFPLPPSKMMCSLTFEESCFIMLSVTGLPGTEPPVPTLDANTAVFAAILASNASGEATRLQPGGKRTDASSNFL